MNESRVQDQYGLTVSVDSFGIQSDHGFYDPMAWVQ